MIDQPSARFRQTFPATLQPPKALIAPQGSHQPTDLLGDERTPPAESDRRPCRLNPRMRSIIAGQTAASSSFVRRRPSVRPFCLLSVMSVLFCSVGPWFRAAVAGARRFRATVALARRGGRRHNTRVGFGDGGLSTWFLVTCGYGTCESRNEASATTLSVDRHKPSGTTVRSRPAAARQPPSTAGSAVPV
jgi:hypothetical protein